MVIACLVLAACKKSAPAPAVPPLASVVTNRANDAAYLSELKKSRLAQNAIARESHAVAEQLAASVERVKAALPPGAGEPALAAALEKDAEWQALKAREVKVSEKDRRSLDAARELIRQRMEREALDSKAVAEGKAVAADPPKPLK